MKVCECKVLIFLPKCARVKNEAALKETNFLFFCFASLSSAWGGGQKASNRITLSE